MVGQRAQIGEERTVKQCGHAQAPGVETSGRALLRPRVGRDESAENLRRNEWLVAHHDDERIESRHEGESMGDAGPHRTANPLAPCRMAQKICGQPCQLLSNPLLLIPGDNHDRRASGNACCPRCPADQRFTAMEQELFWLTEARRGSCREDDRADGFHAYNGATAGHIAGE